MPTLLFVLLHRHFTLLIFLTSPYFMYHNSFFSIINASFQQKVNRKVGKLMQPKELKGKPFMQVDLMFYLQKIRYTASLSKFFIENRLGFKLIRTISGVTSQTRKLQLKKRKHLPLLCDKLTKHNLARQSVNQSGNLVGE